MKKIICVIIIGLVAMTGIAYAIVANGHKEKSLFERYTELSRKSLEIAEIYTLQDNKKEAREYIRKSGIFLVRAEEELFNIKVRLLNKKEKETFLTALLLIEEIKTKQKNISDELAKSEIGSEFKEAFYTY